MQNKVGHAAYGKYAALFSLGLVFQILLDFGISNYNSKMVAQHPERLQSLFPSMFASRILLSLLYVIIVCGIALGLGYRGNVIALLTGVLMIQVFNSMVMFIRSNVSGLHKFKVDGMLSVIDRFLMILVCGFLLLYPVTAKNFRIEWFVLIQIFCYGLAVIIGLIVLKRISGIRLYFSFDLKEVLLIIRKSLPYALLIFLMSVYTRADVMLVSRLCGAGGNEQAGIYAAAYRLLDMGNMFGLMFATMLLPVFGRMLVQRNDVQPIIRLCVNILLPASLVVAIAGIFFGSEIMQLLYRNAGPMDGKVFSWLMLAFPAFCLSNIYSTLLTANGDLKLLNRIAFFGVVINLSLNFLLIPQYFSLGAAITACITQNVLAAAFIVVSQKRVSLSQPPVRIFSFAAFLTMILLAGYFVRLLPVGWIIQLLLLMAIGLSLSFLFRFISLGALKQLVRRSEPGAR